MRNEHKNRSKLMVLAVSILLVVCIPFVFDLKIITSEVEFRGFPFDWLTIYRTDGYKNGYSFNGFGFLLNVIVFYLVLTFVFKRGGKKETGEFK